MSDIAPVAMQRRFMPSLAVLRSFEAAARHESFTLAAEELSLTQSAISRQIKDLELTVGVDLFRRVGRRVKLTEAGTTFASELSLDLERIRQTVFRAVAAGANGGAIRIATLPTFASRWLIPRLPEFEAAHAGIQVNLTTRLKPFDLAAEHIDAALHFGTENWPDARMTKLCEETMVAVASPEFNDRFQIKAPEDLLAAPLIHLESRPTAWNDWFQSAGVDELGAIAGKQFGQFSMIISGAISGLGVALLPTYLIEKELNDGRLVQLHETTLKTANAYYIVTPKGAQSQAVNTFIKWLASAMPRR